MIKKHGISIGLERNNDDFYIVIKAVGRLTHGDYTFMMPVLETAFKEIGESKARVLFDGTEFDGWEMRAAWDDLKLGLKHGNEFSRIAFVGNKKWEALAASVGNCFIKGELKYFEDYDAAIDWLERD